MKNRLITGILFALLIAGTAFGQSTQQFDNSGNGQLNGNFYIREVFWSPGDSNGNLSDGASVYGEITFNPTAGTYSFTGNLVEAASSTGTTPQAYTTKGNYSVSASGYGFMDDLGITGETIFFLVTKGVLIGSSTENLSANESYNMMTIAAPLGSPLATNATFKGTYMMVDFDNPTLNAADTRSALFTLNPDGAGNLSGNTTGSGYIAANGSTATRQSISSVKYAFSNGAGNIFFPGSFSLSNVDTTLIAGNHYVYISPDGNFIFGGSPNGWDMMVGVRTSGGKPSNFGGLYYQAGMDQDFSGNSGALTLDNYFGVFNAISTGVILNHQRFDSLFNSGTFDLTFTDGFTFNSDGSTDDANTTQHYVYSQDGSIRIGTGVTPILGFNVALAAPGLSPPDSGPYLNPTFIENAESFMPFTAQVAPGELLLLFGSGITTKDNLNPFFPTTLNNIQVLVDGLPAPIYYALSNGLIAIQVPYETQFGVANIQVSANGKQSNPVSVFVGSTQPGVFTQTSNGIGYVIAQHFPSFQLVTPSNPAVAGETLIVYVDGLGLVTPTIADGAVANGSYKTTNEIQAFIGGSQATVGFSGLVPSLISVYQLNITVPSGLTAGDNSFELVGFNGTSASGTIDSDNLESKIAIGSGSVTVNGTPQARTEHRSVGARPALHGQPRLGRHALLGRETKP